LPFGACKAGRGGRQWTAYGQAITREIAKAQVHGETMSRRQQEKHAQQQRASAVPPRRGRWTTRAALGLLIAAVIVAVLLLRTRPVNHNPSSPATGDAPSATPAAATPEKTVEKDRSTTSHEDAAGPAPVKRDGGESNRRTATTAKKDAGSEAFRSLKGRWLRGDGDYLLDVKAINADGKVDVTYLNPNPIHVSEAKAAREDSKVKLFVELRDTGYPGCTYNLTYDSQHDLLVGVYYQAAMQEKYEVVFERLP
jgi:hypothetical protein